MRRLVGLVLPETLEQHKECCSYWFQTVRINTIRCCWLIAVNFKHSQQVPVFIYNWHYHFRLCPALTHTAFSLTYFFTERDP